MRLAEFILRDIERIIERWEAFARTLLPAAAAMGSLELRDHAREILEAVADDLATPQTRDEQAAKSMGLAPVPFPARVTAAQTHGVLRAKHGYDIRQLAAEYRALRASVLSLWMEACSPDDPHLDDVIRFNEAIDQALAESIAHFSAQVEQARNLLLGMLSHDMRSPLQTVHATARYLGRLNASDDISGAAQRLISAGAFLQALLDDLVDFNRTNLGVGIRIVRADGVDLATIAMDAVDQLRAAYPGSNVQLQVRGDCIGAWDGKRVQQLVGNLIANAIHHGEAGARILVTLAGEPDAVRIEVSNPGPVIGAESLAQLFEPLKRGAMSEHHGGLGLGLYIVREIAKGHGGTAEARSDERATVFTVTLPRRLG